MSKPSTVLEVLRTERLSAHLQRVVFGGAGFDAFTPNECADMCVKLEFPLVDGQVLLHATAAELDAAPEVARRSYTIRWVNPIRREIAVDFVVHGEHGVAGRWAQHCRPGDCLRVLGPKGKYRPAREVDWYLFAGDESAIPAIASALEFLPLRARGEVLIEVAGADDEIELHAPDGITVHWVHRGCASHDALPSATGAQSPLVKAVMAMPWRYGEVDIFVHGEGTAVMDHLRPYLVTRPGVCKSKTSISGYWRRGRAKAPVPTHRVEVARKLAFDRQEALVSAY